MIGLADLANPNTRSWLEAQQKFSWPAVEQYNIAADCLRSDPAKTALIAIGGAETSRVTYGQLDRLTARLGAALEGLGVGSGDRVAVKLPQSVDMAIAVLAVLRIGAVVVPISNVLGEDALRHRLTDSQPRVLISSGSEAATALAAEVGAIPVSTSADGHGRTLQGLISAVSRSTSSIAATGLDTPALLLYTSGTTGKSKGVLHGHRVLLGHHAIDLALDHIRADDVAYSPVDWAWAGGLLLGLLVPLAHGMTVVAYRETRFDPERTIGILRDAGVSVGLFPPTALRMLQRSERLTHDVVRTLRLRSIVSGAEAVEPELSDWARAELNIAVNNAFGQTEANALIGHSAVLGTLDPGCLGVAYPGHHVAVLDSSLQELPPGEAGEIAVRADDPVCMLRYWNAPEATAEKVRGGWLLTGDAAHADEDHRFYFHGRTDDIIKSGGYRLGPAEIEAAILLHPATAECAVVGLPDPVRGQAVTAYVQLAVGKDADPDLTRELQEQVRRKVGAHAYPRSVRYVTSLPRTATGKVNRAALRTETPGLVAEQDAETAG
jgi:acetyl-CoA synthetase